MGDVSVTFRHLEATSSLREYVLEKVSRARKYFGDRNEINVVLSAEKHRYAVEITLKAKRITVNAKKKQMICILPLIWQWISSIDR